MIKFNEQELRDNLAGGVNLREEINKVIDSLWGKFDRICWLGIGGTYASAMQAQVRIKEKSAFESFVENAASYYTTGNKRINDKTLVVISSVSGTTEEMIKAVKLCKTHNARVFGFIDNTNSPLAELVDYRISYPQDEQLKFFMVADRISYLNKEFDEYNELYKEVDNYFADDIINVYKQADNFAADFAERHHDDKLHYFVGAGTQWGATYSYAMCYWEEQHWLRTRAVEAQEFFHGMFEVVDRDTPVTVYVTEDSQRSLSLRVADFLPKICGNYDIIDAKNYKMPGFSDKFRGFLSPFILHAVNERIDAHIEHINRHPMDIRRYYRKLKY